MRAPELKSASMYTLFAALALALACGTFASAAEKNPAKPAPAKPAPAKDKLPELKPELIKGIEAAIPAQAPATPKKARRILVFWRCEGFFHGEGIAAGNLALELMGKKTGAYTADISRDYEVFEPSNLAKYDAVVLNNTTHIKVPEQFKKGFLDFVSNGKGLIGIHAATDNFNDWPDAAEVMGGVFAGHPWGGGGTWAFKIDAPEHVLTQVFAGKGFKLKDEIYQFKDHYTRADRRVLLSLDLSDAETAKQIIDPKTGKYITDARSGKIKACREDRDFAVSWIKNVGQGRLFYCSLGHGGNVFAEPTILKYYLGGIQYALGDLEANASPKK